MDSLPAPKTSEIICAVYEKLYMVDPKIFLNDDFRRELVFSIERNFPYMNDHAKMYVATRICPFLLGQVFQNLNILHEPIIRNGFDYSLERILWNIQETYAETSTIASEKEEIDDETLSSPLSLKTKEHEDAKEEQIDDEYYDTWYDYEEHTDGENTTFEEDNTAEEENTTAEEDF
jgi:hypothetical protein